MNMSLHTSPEPTEIGDEYMKSHQGYFVSWSLATPGHQYGTWSLIAIDEVIVPGLGDKTSVVVRFVRSLSGTEIAYIQSQSILWWGMKLEGEPWALVMCRPGIATRHRYVHSLVDSNPLRATGV